MAELDPRTGRHLGDHGTYEDALTFALDTDVHDTTDQVEFLRAWRDGALDEWPEFYTWLAKREAPKGDS
jgi:hypothetical protein